MPRVDDCRTRFGPNKYAALHLLLSRWLRNYAKGACYHYVTLGGTELKDCQSLHFIDPGLTTSLVSFESASDRHQYAVATAKQLDPLGIGVTTRKGDIFDFTRESEGPHLFFFDFTGTCTHADLIVKFGRLFADGRLRENDALFVTSYLGRNLGWTRVLGAFDAEFRIIGVSDFEKKKLSYRRAHPSFTLFRALCSSNMQADLLLRCFGCVEYRDSSKMGVYGYVLEKGMTDFPDFIKNAPYFDVEHGFLQASG